MSVSVKLKDIIEELEMQMEESCSFLNIKTGGIVAFTSDDLRAAEDDEPYDHLPEWQQENRIAAIDVIENDENYIPLPDKYDIHEYKIMENFCLTLSDQRKQESMLNAIRGRGAFRRFREKIIDFDIEDQWYSYRDECIKQIAIEWCKENNIIFVE